MKYSIKNGLKPVNDYLTLTGNYLCLFNKYFLDNSENLPERVLTYFFIKNKMPMMNNS